MKLTWITVLSAQLLVWPAWGAPENFDFKDPKGVNAISFKLDAPLEAINGSAGGVSGTVSFDPKNPSATTGKIVVATATMTVPNATQTTHMRGNQWLDADKNPEITFEVNSLKNVKTEGDKTTADVVGTFSVHGVSKDITVPVEMNFLADKLGARMGNNQKGDLLVLKANFSINRSDYKIMPGQMGDKVAEKIDLTVGIVGSCPK